VPTDYNKLLKLTGLPTTLGLVAADPCNVDGIKSATVLFIASVIFDLGWPWILIKLIS